MTAATSHKGPTVSIMPESSGNLLCVRFSGVVTVEDHDEFCDKPLRDIVDTYGSYRFLAYYEDFSGWSAEAADQNFKLISDIHTKAERLAYVNPPERKVLQVSLQRPTLTPDMRFFDKSDLKEALAWIQERP